MDQKLGDLTSRSKHRSNNIFSLSPKSKNKNSTSKLTPNSRNSTNSPKSSNKSKSKQNHVQQNLPVFRASTFKNQALENKLYSDSMKKLLNTDVIISDDNSSVSNSS